MATERVAVVTGAGSGIGRAVALALVADGYHVAIAGRRLEALQETVALAGDGGERMLAKSCDVGDPASVDDFFATFRQRHERLDVLFNNAGSGTPPVPLDELSVAQWQGVVNANLSGMFYCTQHAFRIMKGQRPQGGRIVNNGSISAHVPRPHSAPYTATKHAVTGLTKSVALDGRAHDIACSQIDIGNAETPMTARMPKGVPQADGTMAPEPVMDVRHVADAVLHIANLPLDANVLFMTVMATKMPFVGRG